jgi:hypothetical protein
MEASNENHARSCASGTPPVVRCACEQMAELSEVIFNGTNRGCTQQASGLLDERARAVTHQDHVTIGQSAFNATQNLKAALIW